jgi:hypothetical protein
MVETARSTGLSTGSIVLYTLACRGHDSPDTVFLAVERLGVLLFGPHLVSTWVLHIGQMAGKAHLSARS